MDKHRKILGTLFCIYGGIVFFFTGITLFRNLTLLSFGQILIGFVFVVIYFFMMFGGFYLTRNKTWAYLICLPVAWLSLINIPVGTALGVYYLWFHNNFVKNPS